MRPLIASAPPAYPRQGMLDWEDTKTNIQKYPYAFWYTRSMMLLTQSELYHRVQQHPFSRFRSLILKTRGLFS
jgi:hypothetical protein